MILGKERISTMTFRTSCEQIMAFQLHEHGCSETQAQDSVVVLFENSAWLNQDMQSELRQMRGVQ